MSAAEDNVVSVALSIQDAAISQAGFGTGLLMGILPVALTEKVYGPFADAAELQAAPYSLPATHAVVRMAKAFKGQSPNPKQFKIGARGLADQVIALTPGAPTEGDVYKWELDGVEYNYVAPSTPTVAIVCTGIAAAMSAVTNPVVSDDTTSVSLTRTGAQIQADVMFTLTVVSANLSVENTSLVGSIAGDLAAVKAADDAGSAPGFYGLATDVSDAAAVTAAAAWAESAGVVYLAATQDTECLDAGTTDCIGSALKLAGYNRTAVQYHPKPTEQAPAAAMLGRWLARNPGEITLAAKDLAGVDAVVLTPAQMAALKGKNVDTHGRVGGRGWITLAMASSGRFLDLTRTADWFSARLQEGILQVIASSDKIAQSDADLQALHAPFNSLVSLGVKRGAIAEGTAVLSLPLVGEMLANDRAARIVRGIKFNFRAGGAFHTFIIDGTMSV